MLQQKIDLERAGWKCSFCTCPGTKGYDCINRKNRLITVKLRKIGFKIIKNGYLVDSGHLYQLQEKLAKYEV